MSFTCRAGWGEATRETVHTRLTPTPNPSPRHGEAMLRMDGEGNRSAPGEGVEIVSRETMQVQPQRQADHGTQRGARYAPYSYIMKLIPNPLCPILCSEGAMSGRAQ
jgi:hypothetical protein